MTQSGGAGPAVPRVSPIELLAFLTELGVFALLAVAGWDLGSGVALRLVVACLVPALVMVAWGRWLAPRARRRLPQPRLLVAQLAVFAVSGLLASAAHLGRVAWVLPAGAGLVFGTTWLVERQRTRSVAG